MIAFLARLLGYPVCDSCGAVEWSDVGRAFSVGWRTGADVGTPKQYGAIMLCPACLDGGE